MTAPSAEAAATVTWLRRAFIAEALDGLIYQAEGAIRFLERGDDACAERAMARLFDLAREAAGEMKALRAEPSPAALA